MNGIGKLLAVSLVTMGLSHTIARERIFAPLRERLGGKETWAGYFVSCAYCVSHWVALLLVPLTGTYALDVAPEWGVVSQVLRWILSAILVAVCAAVSVTTASPCFSAGTLPIGLTVRYSAPFIVGP